MVKGNEKSESVLLGFILKRFLGKNSAVIKINIVERNVDKSRIRIFEEMKFSYQKDL